MALAGMAGLALVLSLAACGGSSSDEPVTGASSASPSPQSPSPSESTSSQAPAGSLPQVSGGFGDTPSIDVPDSDPPQDLVVKVLSKGDGPKVESGQLIVVDYLGVRWDDGQTFDSSFDRSPSGFSIGTGAVIPAWDDSLVGLPAGSRVMIVAPPDQAYGDSPPTGGPIQAGDTLVFVVDILGSHAAGETAKGEPAPTEDDSLPYVSITPKEPQIIIPNGDPSKRLIAIPVVVGDGPAVKEGQTVVVQYKGVLWRTGKEFDSSWSRGAPFAIPIGQSPISGWDKGLVGQTVGSRVLLVVPPKFGFGEQGSGPVKGTDTMVFAVDILAAY
jgi:peptidylprolyl isomerase